MKKFFLMILLGAGACQASAQFSRFAAKLNRSDEPVYLTIDQVSATVQGYDGDEVLIEAGPTIAKPVPPEARGLKQLPVTGRPAEDNILRPRLTEDASGIRITIPPGNFKNLSIKVPRSIVLFIRANMNLNEGKITVTGINSIDIQGMLGSVEISKVSNFVVIGGGVHQGSRAKGKVTISDVTWTDAPVMVNGKATHRTYIARSSNLDIDLSIDPSAKTDVIFASEFGQVYSNLDAEVADPLKADVDYIKSYFTLKQGTKSLALNGGGVNLLVDSTYGNIYFRKQ